MPSRLGLPWPLFRLALHYITCTLSRGPAQPPCGGGSADTCMTATRQQLWTINAQHTLQRDFEELHNNIHTNNGSPRLPLQLCLQALPSNPKRVGPNQNVPAPP